MYTNWYTMLLVLQSCAGEEEWLDRSDGAPGGVGELEGGAAGQQAGGVGIAPDGMPGFIQGGDGDNGNAAMERLMSMQVNRGARE
jgi:hypothetical protein